MSPTRRAVLLGATATVVSACSSGRADEVPTAGKLVDGSFTSTRMDGAEVGWAIAYPSGHAPGEQLPVVISLHGRGATYASSFATLHLDSVLDRVVAEGVPPFALAAVDGGDHGYWHPRADGTDPGAMVAEEFLPMLRRRGLGTRRVGLFGWSMGGYGALLLAGQGRVPARSVAVSSPALFTSAGSTPAGAFDSAEDFAAHDVFAHPEWLDSIPARFACGRSDPFYAATRDFVARLDDRPVTSFGPGRHDPAYWRTVAPAQLRFLGERL